MSGVVSRLQIEGPLGLSEASLEESELLLASIQRGLERALPESFFRDVVTFNSEEERLEKLSSLDALLPFISWEICDNVPGELSVFLICHHTSSKIFTFMSHILSYTLLPGKQLIISHEQAMDFSIGEKPYIFCEIGLHIEFQKDLAKIRRNLPFAAAEIRRGITQPHAARSMLERRESFDDAKIKFVYDDLHFLCRRYPQIFDHSIFQMNEAIFTRTSHHFRALRRTRYFSRISASLFYLDKVIRSNDPHAKAVRKQIALRTFPARLRFPFGERNVTGIAIAVSALEANEFCTISHLMNAVNTLLPSVRLVKNSDIAFSPSSYAGSLYYFEIESIDGSPISAEKRSTLRKLLPIEIKGHIEKLIHPVFMPRNDEEIYRSVVRLSQTLTGPKSPPQIVINYEHQIDNHLVFSAVCLRVIPLDAPSLAQLFGRCPHHFFFDQVKIIGSLSSDLVKEANILRIHVGKKKFLRKDGSIDIYKTKMTLLNDLKKQLPDLVDFHHDLMEGELGRLEALRQVAMPDNQAQEHLLESLFYSIRPNSSDSGFCSTALSQLFHLLVEASDEGTEHSVDEDLWMLESDGCSHAVVREMGGNVEEIEIFLSTLDIPSNEFAIGEVSTETCTFCCYVCCSKDRSSFASVIRQGLESYKEKSQSNQTLNLTMAAVSSFMADPKMGYDHESGMIMNLLFSGLMAMNHEDGVTHALAERVEISRDRKTYRFILRDCRWSNGKNLIAYDFEYSWKRMIDSNFSTLYSYLFFIIKNAKKAHEKLAPMDSVGIWAEDEKHLVIELEEPSPYFLELTAQWPFFPVSSGSMTGSRWSHMPKEPHVSCGPFKLSHFKHHKELHLIKNTDYWDEAAVKLERICITTAENLSAQLQMFDNNEIDWVSFARIPLSPEIQRAYEAQDRQHPEAEPELIQCEASSTFSYFINTQSLPFNNTKIRQAFGLALNRQALIDEALTGKEKVSSSILPPAIALQKSPFFKDSDIESAKKLFKTGLAELGLTKEELPEIVITHLKSPLRKRIAEVSRAQWESIFGVRISLEELEWKDYIHKVTFEDYHICGLTWYSCYHDPAEVLDCFKYATNKVNYTHWEHPDYIRLIESASKEYTIEARRRKLLKVEKLLIEQMPIIPLYSNVNTYLKKRRLKGVQISNLGTVNFKYAHIEEQS